MALSSANVRVAVTGAAYVAPTGTAAPTSHNSALNAAFKDFGYLSEDGITESRNRTTEDLRAWQNTQIVRTAVTESGFTVHFVSIETNKTTVEAFYGSSVTDATGLITVDPATTGGAKAWVWDVIDGTAIQRTYVSAGEVTEVGDVVYANGAAIGYEMTVTSNVSPLIWRSALIV